MGSNEKIYGFQRNALSVYVEGQFVIYRTEKRRKVVFTGAAKCAEKSGRGTKTDLCPQRGLNQLKTPAERSVRNPETLN